MRFNMVSFTHKLQIFKSIIMAVSIEMVNDFIREKRTS